MDKPKSWRVQNGVLEFKVYVVSDLTGCMWETWEPMLTMRECEGSYYTFLVKMTEILSVYGLCEKGEGI